MPNVEGTGGIDTDELYLYPVAADFDVTVVIARRQNGVYLTGQPAFFEGEVNETGGRYGDAGNISIFADDTRHIIGDGQRIDAGGAGELQREAGRVITVVEVLRVLDGNLGQVHRRQLARCLRLAGGFLQQLDNTLFDIDFFVHATSGNHGNIINIARMEAALKLRF